MSANDRSPTNSNFRVCSHHLTLMSELSSKESKQRKVSVRSIYRWTLKSLVSLTILLIYIYQLLTISSFSSAQSTYTLNERQKIREVETSTPSSASSSSQVSFIKQNVELQASASKLNHLALGLRLVENPHNEHQEKATGTLITTAKQPCNDCLAVPLLTILGDRRLDGFLSGVPLARQHTKGRPSREPSRRQHHQLKPAAAPAAAAATIATRPHLPDDNYSTHYYDHYNYYKHPSANEKLKPKMDQHCPMTGPMTVCDQITSYPADIILNKLENAKMVLKKNFFNLDSFFSDERENLSDPFEPDTTFNKPSSVAYHYSNKNLANTGGAKVSENPPLSSYDKENHNYDRRYSPSGVTVSVSRQKTAPQRLRERESTRRGINHEDDFVDLVERRAISISNDPLTGLDSYFVDSSIKISEKDKYHLEQPATVVISESSSHNAALTNRLLPMSVSSSNVPQYLGQRSSDSSSGSGNLADFSSSPAVRADRSYQSYERPKRLSSLQRQSYLSLPVDLKVNATSYNTKRSSNQVDGLLSASSSPNRTNSKSSVQLTLTDQASQLRRLKRQSNNEATFSQGDTIDPDRVSEVGETGQQPEPVCKARTIYISPRAALNDKKQWKYIVNTPELNPQIRQVIRVDICQNQFGACSEQVTIPFGYTSQCKQKYSKKKLLALNSENELLEVDTFFVPSCCVCQLIRDTLSVEDSPALERESAGAEEQENSSRSSGSSNGEIDSDGAAGADPVAELDKGTSSGGGSQTSPILTSNSDPTTTDEFSSNFGAS